MACVMDEVQHSGLMDNHDSHFHNNRNLAAVLEQAFHTVLNKNTEYMLPSVSMKLVQHLASQMLSGGSESDLCRQLFLQALSWQLPDLATIRAIIKFAWAASSGNLNNVNATPEKLHAMHEDNQREQKTPDANDLLVCKEALEVLTIALVLNPSAASSLMNSKLWKTALTDLVLVSTSRTVRVSAAELLNVCAIKFNDYFEFPRDLDMEPDTVPGLAKLEGEVIDWDHEEGTCTKYQLTGIVGNCHSGQASGGLMYYSYILHRQADGTAKWYKFDDGDVTECKMEDEEEMKAQCFGSDYMGKVSLVERSYDIPLK